MNNHRYEIFEYVNLTAVLTVKKGAHELRQLGTDADLAVILGARGAGDDQ